MEKVLKNKKVFILAGGILAALLLIYIGFSLYFMNHFFFQTSLNGMDVSGWSVKKVKSSAQAQVADYELLIIERNEGKETLRGSDFSLKLEWDDSVQRLLAKQNGFAWIAHIFQKNELENSSLVSYDEQKLQNLIGSLSCMQAENQVEPVSAGVSDYVPGQGFTLVPAVQGSAVNPEKLTETLTEAICGLQEEVSLEETGCYQTPAIGDDDERLSAALETLNRYAGTVITYQIGEDTQVLDGETISGWLGISDTAEPVIDEEKVEEYVSSLSKKYNTCYSIKKVQTTYGPTVTLDNNDYGWKVDKDAEKAAIIEEVKAGVPVTRDLYYSRTANSREGNNCGDSYVEINLTAQHMFLYKEGKLIIESDIVSGNLSRGFASPTGINGVTYKELNATLRGEDYATPVTYWMPFNGNVGMHDATWRSSFGGSNYKTNGSRGCINLPPSVAKVVYENITEGYPVIVYELPGTESPKGIAQDAAAVVKGKINSIGAVTPESGAVIGEARSMYDALSDMAKGYVSNYEVLVQAEAAYAALQGQQLQPQQTQPQVPPAQP